LAAHTVRYSPQPFRSGDLIQAISEAALLAGTLCAPLLPLHQFIGSSLALEKYQAEAIGNKHKTLGRFPLRNRFIADYIREVTGKKRTPKQVGSRLQQLRDTCKEERSKSRRILLTKSALKTDPTLSTQVDFP